MRIRLNKGGDPNKVSLTKKAKSSRVRLKPKGIAEPSGNIYNQPAITRTPVREFLSLAEAIILDGKVSESEYKAIKSWLAEKSGIAGEALSPFFFLLNEIESHGSVTEDDRNKLFMYLYNAVQENGKSFVPGDLCDRNEKITFPHRWFTFTGELVFGDREKAAEMVVSRGGFHSDSYNRRTDYLVIGGLGSAYWKYGKFGTKVETALRDRADSLSTVKIISEQDFVAAVINTEPIPETDRPTRPDFTRRKSESEIVIDFDDQDWEKILEKLVQGK